MFVWIATILRGIAFAFSAAPSFASMASSMGKAMVIPAARRKVRRLRGFNMGVVLQLAGGNINLLIHTKTIRIRGQSTL